MTDDSSPGSIGALVLLSTLRTAVEVRFAMAERRAGRDPSEQEDARSVEAYLREVMPELGSLATRLRVGLVVERGEGEAVFAFEDRLALSRLARELHVVHQRLLSLYPDVPESLIEEVRLRQREAERLTSATGDGFERALIRWLDRTSALFEGLAKLVEPAN